MTDAPLTPHDAPVIERAHPVFADAPASVTFKKLRKRILRNVTEVISAYGLDQPGRGGGPARWLVCLSGGKDSYTLLAALLDRDDALETFMMNVFHGGRLAAMPPKLVNDEGDLLVLRPLLFCAESDIARFANAMAFPIIPCNLCGSQDGLQRQAMKALLDEWERKAPGGGR